MLNTIKVDDESPLSLDTNGSPNNNEIDTSLHTVNESILPSPSIFKVAYACENDYKYFKETLDYLKTTNVNDVKSIQEIYQLKPVDVHGCSLSVTSEYSYNSYYTLPGLDL